MALIILAIIYKMLVVSDLRKLSDSVKNLLLLAIIWVRRE
jgi:hypothetical protein